MNKFFIRKEAGDHVINRIAQHIDQEVPNLIIPQAQFYQDKLVQPIMNNINYVGNMYRNIPQDIGNGLVSLGNKIKGQRRGNDRTSEAPLTDAQRASILAQEAEQTRLRANSKPPVPKWKSLPPEYLKRMRQDAIRKWDNRLEDR